MAEEARDGGELLHLLLDMGEAMLASGAEISRVETTISRMGHSAGATEVSVFVIISMIVVTLGYPDGSEYTETRRVRYTGSTNLARLERLNALSRRYCSAPMSDAVLAQDLAAAKQVEVPKWAFWVGNAVAAGAFSVFFGGAWIDGLFAAVLALLICLCIRLLSVYSPNNLVFNLVVAFLMGCIGYGTLRFIPFLHVDKVLIGDIMLLIPGMAMTTALRDMLTGDTLSGALRLIESLLWAVGLAAGFMLSMLLVGGV